MDSPLIALAAIAVLIIIVVFITGSMSGGIHQVESVPPWYPLPKEKNLEMTEDEKLSLFKSGYTAGYSAGVKDEKQKTAGIPSPLKSEPCGGLLEFQQEIHNGNDAYKCSKCGGILVIKMLESEICNQKIQIVSYETINENGKTN